MEVKSEKPPQNQKVDIPNEEEEEEVKEKEMGKEKKIYPQEVDMWTKKDDQQQRVLQKPMRKGNDYDRW